MQSFETLFRRAWERSRELKLGGYILLNWAVLLLLAAVLGALTFGAYYVLIEKRQMAHSVVEANPELRKIFAPRRKIKLNDTTLTFDSRRGDKLKHVVLRAPDRELRAKSAELRLNAEENTLALTMRRYRIHEITGGEPDKKPISSDDWGTLDMVYPFALPPGLRLPAPPAPGGLARALTVISGITLIGAVLWFWAWRIFAAGVLCEAQSGRPTRLLRGFRAGVARWRSVMYPLVPISLCGVVSFVGSLPNILQLPTAFYLAVYPLACALEITLLILSGIMMAGVAVEPPGITFGALLRNSTKVFLDGWGRYLFGTLWIYAFFALFAVMLIPGLLPLLDAAIFRSRFALSVSIVWLAVWFAAFVAAGVRVRGCIAAYYIYLYADASGAPRDAAENPESDAK